MGRTIALPNISVSLSSEPVIKRGIMNRMEYTVKNNSPEQQSNIIIKSQVGGYTHQSQVFSLAPEKSRLIPVIVGGYTELEDIEDLTTTLEITPHAGEKASIIRTSPLEVKDSMMVLDIGNEEFIRGGKGKVWFTLENPGAADVEIITAENSNKKVSSEIRYYLLDEDENVLYSKSFMQSLGNQIVTLANKKTVARIEKGGIFTSTPMDLFIPANAPDIVYVRLEIDHIYYHLGQADQVKMNGTRTRQKISLKDTSYMGSIVSIVPEVSKGDEDITITGTAKDRSTDELLADAALHLIIKVNGFERKINVTTGENGQFIHIFTPLENEAGVYHVHAIHPDLLDRPDQGSFIINQVGITPAKFNLSIPKNYQHKISIKVTTQKGTRLTNLRPVLAKPLEQGVHLDLSDPISVVDQDKSVTLNLNLWADNTAKEMGQIELSILSDESSITPWGSVLINTHFSESRPVLYFMDRGTPY